MINNINMYKLYDGVINNEELTTKVLNHYGFNSKDLAELIDKGVLERIKRGHYSFLDVDNLYLYGKRLIFIEDYAKAENCFLTCYELNPNHIGACFQLFLRSVDTKQYSNAFDYFETLHNIDDPYYVKDTNLFLHLLSFVTDIPNKYKKYAFRLKYEDVCIDINNKRYKNKPLRNKIRKSIMKNKFSHALELTNDLMRGDNSIHVQDLITKYLIHQVIRVEAISRNQIIEFINTKQYDQIVSILEKKEDRHNLSLCDQYTLWIAKNILIIKETNTVPKYKNLKTQNMFHAMDCNNFQLALEICKSLNSKNNIDVSKNTIYMLLKDVCELINEMSNLNNEGALETEQADQTAIEAISTSEQKETSFEVKCDSVSFADIAKSLFKKDMDEAFDKISVYMSSINKENYEFLVVDLIKIGMLENDFTFRKTMTLLSCLSKDDFKFDASTYIQEFYIALAENKFDEARIYLDIICNANKIDENYILTDGLLQVLDNTEKSLQYKKKASLVYTDESGLQKQEINTLTVIPDNNYSLAQDIQTGSDTSLDFYESKTTELCDIICEEVEQPKPNTKTLIENNMDNDEEFIESKHSLLLKNKGIVLLEPMKKDRRRRLHDLVERYPDMVSFSVGEGTKRRIVIRYKPIITEYVDYKILSGEAKDAYKARDYDGAMDKFLQLLQVGNNPPAWVYGNIGLCHMKKYCLNVAIDYLTVADYLSQKQNVKYGYTELIARLNYSTAKKDAKPIVKMDIEEFESDENNYGIKNVEQITKFISETGLDVESACKHFGMNDEQIDTVRLIYAKDFYSQGWYEKGEEFLKSVEQSKNKTKHTTSLYKEIQRDKKFYANRIQENPRQLSLTMKPRKKNK